jgi:hypothetical protein
MSALRTIVSAAGSLAAAIDVPGMTASAAMLNSLNQLRVALPPIACSP